MAESVQETVRLPESLVKVIDSKYVESGMYSSRADFVYCAIRYYYENSVYSFVRYAEIAHGVLESDPLLKKLFPTTLSLVKTYFHNIVRYHHIDDYEGAKVSVLLRLPPMFVRSYTRFVNESCIYKSKADFFNRAIEYYLDCQYYVGTIHEAIHSRDASTINYFRNDNVFLETLSPIKESEPAEHFEEVNVRDAAKEDWLDDLKPSKKFLDETKPEDIAKIRAVIYSEENGDD